MPDHAARPLARHWVFVASRAARRDAARASTTIHETHAYASPTQRKPISVASAVVVAEKVEFGLPFGLDRLADDAGEVFRHESSLGALRAGMPRSSRQPSVRTVAVVPAIRSQRTHGSQTSSPNRSTKKLYPRESICLKCFLDAKIVTIPLYLSKTFINGVWNGFLFRSFFRRGDCGRDVGPCAVRQIEA